MFSWCSPSSCCHVSNRNRLFFTSSFHLLPEKHRQITLGYKLQVSYGVFNTKSLELQYEFNITCLQKIVLHALHPSLSSQKLQQKKILYSAGWKAMRERFYVGRHFVCVLCYYSLNRMEVVGTNFTLNKCKMP